MLARMNLLEGPRPPGALGPTDYPIWLSTSGLGVYWLHMRLDRRPKYYTYEPFKEFGDAREGDLDNWGTHENPDVGSTGL